MKKRTLRAAAMMMTAAMCAGMLAGCGGGKAETAAPTPAPAAGGETTQAAAGDTAAADTGAAGGEGRIQVSFWEGLKGSHLENIEKIVNDYNNSQDKVWVTVSYQGDYNETAAQAQTALAAGNQPNLCQLEVSRIKPFFNTGKVLDLKPFAEKDGLDLGSFYEGLMSFSYDESGALASLPFNRSTYIMYYNKDMFKEVGLDPEAPPTTWAELKDAATKLSIDGKRWGFSIPADGMFLESLVFQCGGTSLNEDGTDIGFNNEAGIEAIDFLKGMMNDGLMKTPAGEDYTSFDSCRNDFIGGTVGIIYSSSGDINYLTESTEFELGVAMLPANTEQGVGSGGANIVMFDGFSDEENAATWDFVKYLCDPEVAGKFASLTGYLPTSPAAAESTAFKEIIAKNPAYQVPCDMLNYVKERPYHPYYTEYYYDVLNDAISQILLDPSYTGEVAVKDISNRAKRLLNQ